MASWRKFRTAALLSSLMLVAGIAPAGAQARFDLTGPPIDVRVTRGDVTLPIAQVPNLQANDELWLHPKLPPTQSVHYLLIVAFLRGTTNPPPDDWFTRIETWTRGVAEEGAFVRVPPDAQQAVMFLAPETGGDFPTLRNAVKGHPGIFVRASADLEQAGFEQARVDKYLAALKQIPPGDSKALEEHSELLARTLSLKPNPDCFKQPPDRQEECLTQVGAQTLLDDGHAQSMLAALSNADSANLINTASATQPVGGGLYSAYVGTIVDFVHIMDGLHTAKYQYIPAIAIPDTASAPESLNLRLNAPPSFNNPKSVIVIALPAVEKAIPPPLRAVDPNHIACLLDPKVVLPIDGAPLVYSTGFAHNLVLHVGAAGSAKPADLSLAADAYRGGLIVVPAPKRKELTLNGEGSKPEKPGATPQNPPGIVAGEIEGRWGFDNFTGPTVRLQNVPGSGWKIVTAADTNLIIGQPNHIQVASSGTACIKSIDLGHDLGPGDAKVDWKLGAAKPEKADGKSDGKLEVPTVDVTLNLQHAATPGSIHLAIAQFGEAKPDEIGTRTFSEAAKLQGLQVHAGDTDAVLTGASLDQVKTVTVNDLTYSPHCDGAPCDKSSISLALGKDAKPPSFHPGEKLSAEVHLNDGRTVAVAGSVLPPRPGLSLLSRRVAQAPPSPIKLAGEGDLPLGGKLTFVLKSKSTFPRSEQIELANMDESLKTTLSVNSGSLIMEDTHTVLATFDPLKTFGPSTFGQLRLRAIAPDGAEGDWLPLATVVRLPELTGIHCPADPAAQCELQGSELYLIEALSLNEKFDSPVAVPDGFVDGALSLPRPPVDAGATQATSCRIYLRLRDDPSATHPVTLPVATDAPTPAKPE